MIRLWGSQDPVGKLVNAASLATSMATAGCVQKQHSGIQKFAYLGESDEYQARGSPTLLKVSHFTVLLLQN